LKAAALHPLLQAGARRLFYIFAGTANDASNRLYQSC
jgi:hypothetical protein